MTLAEKIADARARLAKAERRADARAVRLSGSIERLKLALDPELAEAYAESKDDERLAKWSRQAVRDGLSSTHYGMRTGAANCASCGAFKGKPADVCGQCGDDPVSWNGDERDFNRAHGYAG